MADSMDPTVANAQQLPHCPWSRIAGTIPEEVRQSNELGRVTAGKAAYGSDEAASAAETSAWGATELGLLISMEEVTEGIQILNFAWVASGGPNGRRYIK